MLSANAGFIPDLQGGCQCDASKGWSSDGSGGCECNGGSEI